MIKRLIVLSLFALTSFLITAAPASAAPTIPMSMVAATCRDDPVTALLGLRAWDACLAHDANGVPQPSDLTDIWLSLIHI